MPRGRTPKPVAPPIAVVPAAETTPKPPARLGKTGRDTWQRTWTSCAAWLNLSDYRLIERLAQLADDREAMRTIVAQDGLMTLGSTGQWRAHPLLTEIRAIEAAMLRIETELGIGPLARKRLGVATVTTRSTLDELAVRRRGPENPC
jgi:P27 family predicted phage terminase small subunit